MSSSPRDEDDTLDYRTRKTLGELETDLSGRVRDGAGQPEESSMAKPTTNQPSANDEAQPSATQDMAAALAYRDYDVQFVFGERGHTLIHGGAIFPDTLRWLWCNNRAL